MNALAQSFPACFLQELASRPVQSGQQSCMSPATGNVHDDVLTRAQILLVPTTECLLFGRDRDSESSYTDLSTSEDFLASHVIRTLGSGSLQGHGNVRENRGKAKQLNTINGRTIIVKDLFVYSNKGAPPNNGLSRTSLNVLQGSGTSTNLSFSTTSFSITMP